MNLSKDRGLCRAVCPLANWPSGRGAAARHPALHPAAALLAAAGAACARQAGRRRHAEVEPESRAQVGRVVRRRGGVRNLSTDRAQRETTLGRSAQQNVDSAHKKVPFAHDARRKTGCDASDGRF